MLCRGQREYEWVYIWFVGEICRTALFTTIPQRRRNARHKSEHSGTYYKWRTHWSLLAYSYVSAIVPVRTSANQVPFLRLALRLYNSMSMLAGMKGTQRGLSFYPLQRCIPWII